MRNYDASKKASFVFEFFGINRTCEELRREKQSLAIGYSLCINRTCEELRLRKYPHIKELLLFALIEPVRNYDYVLILPPSTTKSCINRTCEELRHRRKLSFQSDFPALIEPVRNYDFHDVTGFGFGFPGINRT